MISLAGLGAAPRAYMSGLDDNLALLQKQQAQQSLTAYGKALPNVMGQPTGPSMPPMNPSQYDSLFEQTGAKYGVPGALLKAVAKQESSFNPNAKSPAGAQGLMQFMPPTAQRFGVDPFNPASSVDGAARYLKTLYDQFGDWKLALAGYNWGEGNVGKWLQSGADPNRMPAETRNYIANLAPVAEQAAGMVQGGAGGGAGMLAPGMMSPQPMAQQGGMQPPQPGIGSPQVPGMAVPQPAWARPRPQPGLSSPQVPGAPQAPQQMQPGLSSPQVPGQMQMPPAAPNRAGGQMAQPGMAPPAGGQGEPPMAQLPASMAGTLDWRSLITAIQERNPGISPEVLALTVDRFAPYMENQSAREWEMQKMQMEAAQSGAASPYRTVGNNVFNEQTGQWIQPPGGEGAAGAAGATGAQPKPLPAELSARIGLATEFLRPDNLKFLREGIAAGNATGLDDWAKGQVGWGESGEIRRRMQSGADALRRMLTGAGMNQNEVSEYIGRYLPALMDGPEILSDKFEQMVKELTTIREATMLGRGLMINMDGDVVVVGDGEQQAPGATAPPPADAGGTGDPETEKWLAIASQAIADGDPPEEVLQWLRDTHGIEAEFNKDGAN